MANYSIVINPFKARTFEDYTKPYREIAAAYKAEQELYDAMELTIEAMDSMINPDNDPETRKLYDAFMSKYNKVVSDLHKSGKSLLSRQLLKELKREYYRNIIPIQAAIARRNEQVKDLLLKMSKDESLEPEFDILSPGGASSLDRYMKDLNYGYGRLFSANKIHANKVKKIQQRLRLLNAAMLWADHNYNIYMLQKNTTIDPYTAEYIRMRYLNKSEPGDENAFKLKQAINELTDYYTKITGYKELLDSELSDNYNDYDYGHGGHMYVAGGGVNFDNDSGISPYASMFMSTFNFGGEGGGTPTSNNTDSSPKKDSNPGTTKRQTKAIDTGFNNVSVNAYDALRDLANAKNEKLAKKEKEEKAKEAKEKHLQGLLMHYEDFFSPDLEAPKTREKIIKPILNILGINSIDDLKALDLDNLSAAFINNVPYFAVYNGNDPKMIEEGKNPIIYNTNTLRHTHKSLRVMDLYRFPNDLNEENLDLAVRLYSEERTREWWKNHSDIYATFNTVPWYSNTAYTSGKELIAFKNFLKTYVPKRNGTYYLKDILKGLLDLYNKNAEGSGLASRFYKLVPSEANEKKILRDLLALRGIDSDGKRVNIQQIESFDKDGNMKLGDNEKRETFVKENSNGEEVISSLPKFYVSGNENMRGLIMVYKGKKYFVSLNGGGLDNIVHDAFGFIDLSKEQIELENEYVQDGLALFKEQLKKVDPKKYKEMAEEDIEAEFFAQLNSDETFNNFIKTKRDYGSRFVSTLLTGLLGEQEVEKEKIGKNESYETIYKSE